MPAALTPKTAISTALLYFEGLTADDLGNTRNRAQLLILLQGIQDEVENEKNLRFLYTQDATLVINADAESVALPTNFKDVGDEGSLWIPALNRELDGPVQQQRIVTERLKDGDAAKEIFEYAIWDGKIQTVKAASSTSLLFNYVRRPTALSDASDITDSGPDDSTPFLIPAAYHYTVLLPGLLSRSNGVKSEIRDVQKGIYERGRAQMLIRERIGRGGIELMPEQLGVQY